MKLKAGDFDRSLLKRKRIKEGWSQLELGRMVDVTQQTINLWEVGKNRPQMKNIMRLATVFGLKVPVFFVD